MGPYHQNYRKMKAEIRGRISEPRKPQSLQQPQAVTAGAWMDSLLLQDLMSQL